MRDWRIDGNIVGRGPLPEKLPDAKHEVVARGESAGRIGVDRALPTGDHFLLGVWQLL
jgi:hypothetical protein